MDITAGGGAGVAAGGPTFLACFGWFLSFFLANTVGSAILCRSNFAARLDLKEDCISRGGMCVRWP